MLFILFIATIIFILFLGVMRTGRLFNPLTFYSLFWGIWSIVSMKNPFMLYVVSTKTYLIVWLNLVATFIGFIIVNQKEGKIQDNILFNKRKLMGDYLLNTKLFLLLQVLVFVILIFLLRRYNILLASMTTQDIRRIVYEQGLLFDSSFSSILYFWFVTPIVKVSILLFLSNLIINGKKN
ncbi:MAG: hypothetical protein K6T94_17815, partial [Paenibacillus sp.]|nr:hypothetical protein [Paenibacillus sp.]